MPVQRTSRPLAAVKEFLQTEAAGGVLLLAATLVALAWANSPWAQAYDDVWHATFTVGIDPVRISLDLQHWVNDALMALFFFLIGLEIKRELVVGELRDPRAAALPVLGAVGGMVAPALLFVLVAGGGELARGWGIPMATDIAFAVGILAILGPRVPQGLKVFLLTLAIIDDIGAIIVIGAFYSEGIQVSWLFGSVLAVVVVLAMRRLGVTRPLAYVPLGVVMWVCTYEAGIHATIAGVALGLLTPARPVGGRDVLHDLEHGLHPWTSYLIVPLFALANAGVSLGNGAFLAALSNRLTWAVIAGLVIGKIAGVTGMTLAGLAARVGQLPPGVTRVQVLGAAALSGIGFTVSLFITGLAFTDPQVQASAKIGILIASAAAAATGVVVLLRSLSAPRRAEGVPRLS